MMEVDATAKPDTTPKPAGAMEVDATAKPAEVTTKAPGPAGSVGCVVAMMWKALGGRRGETA